MQLAAASSSFGNSLEHILGFVLVIAALVLLWALTSLIGRVFKTYAPVPCSPEPEPKEVVAEPSPEPVQEKGPSEEEVAVIAATVALLTRQRSRIVSIRSTTKDWNREGRREHFASHKIR